MSSHRLDLSGREARLLRAYRDSDSRIGHKTRSTDAAIVCSDFRRLHAGASVLDRRHDTFWVGTWLLDSRPRLMEWNVLNQVRAICQWMGWLFDRHEIDGNAFYYVSPQNLVRGRENPICLRNNLQRLIADFLGQRAWTSRRWYLENVRALHSFNRFLNSNMQPHSTPPPVDTKMVTAWMMLLTSRSQRTPEIHIRILDSFFRFAVLNGHLPENPFDEGTIRIVLGKAHGVHPWENRGGDSRVHSDTATTPTIREGPLSIRIRQYLALKRASGEKQHNLELILREFDRFLARRRGAGSAFSKEDVMGWIGTKPGRKRRTMAARIRSLIGFARWLRRYEPRAYIPDEQLVPRPGSTAPAYILTKGQIVRVLGWMAALTNHGWPIRSHVLHTAILLLYCTGMRVSEACNLRLRDIDWRENTLLIRDTKFYKTRLIVISTKVAGALHEYIRVRNSTKAMKDPEAPLFWCVYGRSVSPATISNRFAAACRELGFKAPAGRVGPRLHDLRHTFAVHNLVRWYRQGGDMEAKLPLLATYMGHTFIEFTQTYLTVTAELLGLATERFHARFGHIIAVKGGQDEKQAHSGRARPTVLPSLSAADTHI